MRSSILLAALLALGVTRGVAGEPNTPAVAFFEKQVRPLLVEHCHECHSTKAKKTKGGLALDSRDAILKGGESGPAVVPGQPEKSVLVGAVRWTNDKLKMPPKSKLSSQQISILEKWVKDGAVFPTRRRLRCRRSLTQPRPRLDSSGHSSHCKPTRCQPCGTRSGRSVRSTLSCLRKWRSAS